MQDTQSLIHVGDQHSHKIHPFTTFLFLKTLRHSYFKLTPKKTRNYSGFFDTE